MNWINIWGNEILVHIKSTFSFTNTHSLHSVSLPLSTYIHSFVYYFLISFARRTMGKCNQIRQIVRIRQMLRRWRNSSTSSPTRFIPSDVPAGHVAISVGSGHTRFIMRATYLNHPVFRKLLAQAEEEYGFNNQGPLAVPCDESAFLDILRLVTSSESSNSARVDDFQICCQLGIKWSSRFRSDQSRPLLLS